MGGGQPDPREWRQIGSRSDRGSKIDRGSRPSSPPPPESQGKQRPTRARKTRVVIFIPASWTLTRLLTPA